MNALVSRFAYGSALALTLSLATIPAHAEWTKVSGEGFVTTYADLASIVKTDDLVTMWSLIDFQIEQEASNGKQFLSLKSRFEYDCAKQLNRALELTSYSGQSASGDTIMNRSEPTGWLPVKANTVSRTLWELACGKK